MERLIEWDTSAFCWINHHNNTVLDWIMWTVSQSWSWAIILIAFYSALTLKYERKQWWIVLVGIMLCFLFSDRISVLAFKQVFCRLRPCHVIEDVNMFKTGCGGSYGFVSSHAANISSIITLLIMRYIVMKKRGNPIQHRTPITIILVIWGLLVCYSRPYLGKHYPGDVICGALLGIAIGMGVWWLTTILEKRLLIKKKSTN